MSNENASAQPSTDPRAKKPNHVGVSLRVVVEVSFTEVFRDDQTVGQVQRSATDRVMGALQDLFREQRTLQALFLDQQNEALHFRVVDRESAELKIVTQKEPPT